MGIRTVILSNLRAKRKGKTVPNQKKGKESGARGGGEGGQLLGKAVMRIGRGGSVSVLAGKFTGRGKRKKEGAVRYCFLQKGG